MSAGSTGRGPSCFWWRRRAPIVAASAVFALLLVLALVRLLLPSL